MKAIFVVPVIDSNMVVPDVTELLPDGTARDGCGYSALGMVPQNGTALVLIDSSDAIIDAMAADPDYLWIEDVA